MYVDAHIYVTENLSHHLLGHSENSFCKGANFLNQATYIYVALNF